MAADDELDPSRYDRKTSDFGDEKIVERTSRGGWRWLWVWPVIAALVLWWAGWGWGGSGGWWFGRTHAQNTRIPVPPGSRTTETIANTGARQPETSAGADAGGAKLNSAGSGVDILASRDKVIFIGQRFQAKDVPVQKRVNARVLWIGEGNPMLAVVDNTPKGAAKTVGPGKDVDATGTVRQAPAPAQAKQQWALSDQDMSQLEKQGAYIELSELTAPQAGMDH